MTNIRNFLDANIEVNQHPIVTGDYIIVTPQIKNLTQSILFIITI